MRGPNGSEATRAWSKPWQPWGATAHSSPLIVVEDWSSLRVPLAAASTAMAATKVLRSRNATARCAEEPTITAGDGMHT